MTIACIAKLNHSNHVIVTSMYKNNNSIITKDETGTYLTLRFKQEDRYKYKYANIDTGNCNLMIGTDESRTFTLPGISAFQTYNANYICSNYFKSRNIKAGDKLTISFDIVIDSGVDTILFWVILNSPYTALGQGKTATKTQQRLSFVYTATNDVTLKSNCIFQLGFNNPSTDTVITVSNLKIEAGTTASAWSLAPEEIASDWSSKTQAEKSEISETLGASINSVNLFSKRYIYGWTLHNQDTFDYQNILNNFRRIDEYENDDDAVNKNYLFSDTQSTAPKPYEHEYSSHSQIINFLDLKTQLADASIKTSTKPTDLLFLCVTEYGDMTPIETDVSYDPFTGNINFVKETKQTDICSLSPKYTVIPIFDKNIFSNIATDAATECITKRKHQRDNMLYDMLKLKAISDALSAGDFGNAIDFWNAFILKKNIEYDDCIKEENGYDKECNCNYIVNYD